MKISWKVFWGRGYGKRGGGGVGVNVKMGPDFRRGKERKTFGQGTAKTRKIKKEGEQSRKAWGKGKGEMGCYK